mmetsp:Transcript_16792/g.52673  ORF Transcript_16792/g.52673 Transcript_16792/m.52673 type:complete len:408 (-) Transcript_16792:590-1813(-)
MAISHEEPRVNEYAVRKGGKFFEALKSGTMAVIKGNYFLDCLEKKQPFGHRAQIEEKAPGMIFEGSEAAELWLKNGRKFLVVISYCWLSKEHPDPDMFHLPYLRATIAAMKEREAVLLGLKEVGVILDYCSFYQEPRTEEQMRSFKECLGLINVPYGHSDVTSAKLVSVPSTEQRTYDDRGWTKFESDVIDSKPPAAQDVTGEFNVLTISSPGCSDLWQLAKNQRRPPVTPTRFRSEMEDRRKRAEAKNVRLFTNGKDQEFLETKYDETFSAMCAFVDKLDYKDKGFGVAEAKQLVEVLPHFAKLQRLELNRNKFGDEGAKMIALALADGAAPMLQNLGLHSNSIGSEGARALAKALSDGAAPKLEILDLRLNKIESDGARVLAKVQGARNFTIRYDGPRRSCCSLM